MAAEQRQCAWIIAVGLKPKATHVGAPCTRLCRIGVQEVDQACRRLMESTQDSCDHQERNGLLAPVENPKGSVLFRMRYWGVLWRPQASAVALKVPGAGRLPAQPDVPRVELSARSAGGP